MKSEIRSGSGQRWLAVVALVLAMALNSPAASSGTHDEVARLTAVLQSGASQKEKADACRELARIGDKSAVAALAALLPDEKLSHMARYGLETIPDSSVDRAFREALEQLKGRPLVGVIGSIGVRKDANATKPLAKLLTDPDPDVAQAAARSLGSIGTPAAAKALQRAVAAAAPGNQVAFCEGLFRCAENLAAHGRSRQAIAIYDQVRKLKEPHQVRTAALRGAILARGKAGLPLLAESLQSSDYAVFAAAARISNEMSGPDVTRALATALFNNSSDREILLLQTLGARQDPTALPALCAVLGQNDKPVRLAAIRALSQLGQPAAVPVFQELLTDKDFDVAMAGKEALATFPGLEADSAALYLLKSSDPNRRDLGFELVGRRQMTSAVPDLLRMADDPDPKVRLAALKRVGELASPSDLPALLDLLSRARTPQDIDAIEQALKTVATKGPPSEATAKQLAETFNDAPLEHKCALVRVLATIGGPTALNCVRTAVKGPPGEVRTTAIRALGSWSTADAAPDLLNLARNASDPGEKMLCLRGYLGLAALPDLPPNQALAICRNAVALVQQPEEKKLLLGSLGNLHTVDSLALITPYLDDASVQGEAATACMNVSEKLLQGPNAAKDAPHLLEPLRKAAQVAPNADLAKKAQSLLEEARKKAQ